MNQSWPLLKQWQTFSILDNEKAQEISTEIRAIIHQETDIDQRVAVGLSLAMKLNPKTQFIFYAFLLIELANIWQKCRAKLKTRHFRDFIFAEKNLRIGVREILGFLERQRKGSIQDTIRVAIKYNSPHLAELVCNVTPYNPDPVILDCALSQNAIDIFGVLVQRVRLEKDSQNLWKSFLLKVSKKMPATYKKEFFSYFIEKIEPLSDNLELIYHAKSLGFIEQDQAVDIAIDHQDINGVVKILNKKYELYKPYLKKAIKKQKNKLCYGLLARLYHVITGRTPSLHNIVSIISSNKRYKLQIGSEELKSLIYDLLEVTVIAANSFENSSGHYIVLANSLIAYMQKLGMDTSGLQPFIIKAIKKNTNKDKNSIKQFLLLKGMSKLTETRSENIVGKAQASIKIIRKPELQDDDKEVIIKGTQKEVGEPANNLNYIAKCFKEFLNYRGENSRKAEDNLSNQLTRNEVAKKPQEKTITPKENNQISWQSLVKSIEQAKKQMQYWEKRKVVLERHLEHAKQKIVLLKAYIKKTQHRLSFLLKKERVVS